MDRTTAEIWGRSAPLLLIVLPLLLNHPIASPEGNGNDLGEVVGVGVGDYGKVLAREILQSAADRSLSENGRFVMQTREKNPAVKHRSLC